MRQAFSRSSLAFFQFFIPSLFSYFPIHHRLRCDDRSKILSFDRLCGWPVGHGELFKWRYGKSSANHGVTDPVPVGITSVDNLADFAPAVKNQVPSVTIQSILLRPSKIWYPGLLGPSKIRYPGLIIRPIMLPTSKI
jgi:hypothetical protein